MYGLYVRKPATVFGTAIPYLHIGFG